MPLNLLRLQITPTVHLHHLPVLVAKNVSAVVATLALRLRRLISFFALEECGGIMGLRDFCRPVAMYYECRGI